MYLAVVLLDQIPHLFELKSADIKSQVLVGSTLMGGWLGAFLLPLDWQKEYQKYPVPIVYGIFIGNSVGKLYNFIAS
jgi:hypothetical protein